MKAAILLLLVSGVLLAGGFEVGQLKEGRVAILCENGDEVFIAGPDGLHRLGVSSENEVSFSPLVNGHYTIQCGREVKEAYFEIGGANEMREEAPHEIAGIVLLAFSFLLMLLMLVAAAYVFANYLNETRFCKEICEGKVLLYLECRKKMQNIRIVDPLYLHAEKPKEFALPLLEAGSIWKYEYELPAGKHPLPATLVAKVGDREIALLSEIIPTNGQGQKAKQQRLLSAVPPAQGPMAQTKSKLPRFQPKTKER
ncbi:MAG: hypothetical protein N3G80_02720 [Candidatus Micrarchaeota archaeon]|nr:hypothetical protein [Candidatus Micrarchaeota archaeon]